MVTTRELQIGENHFTIHEHELSDSDSATGADLAGASLWDCALALAHYLPLYHRSGPVGGKRALELGAGTGLPGLVAATLGARVTLTDLPHLLPGLRRNVAANSADARVLPLEWGFGGLSDLGEDRPFDLILMSDLLYNVTAAQRLCQTLRSVSDRRSEIVMAYELRPGTTECFRVLKESGFGWVKIGNEELDPVWQSDDIGIFRLFNQN